MSTPGKAEIKWRGSAMIRTSSRMTHGLWPAGRLLSVPDGLEVRVLGASVVLRPHEICELRFYWRLFPRFVAITRQVGQVSMASFTVIRGTDLKALLIQKGFQITCEAKWQPFNEFSADTRAYGFYQGGE